MNHRPAMLANFKVGDLVKFKADRVDGAIKVTALVAPWRRSVLP